MSGTASVSNTFAAQTGNIPLSQLDTNFSDLTTYANDPTNRYNYAGDTGGTNTIALSFSPQVTAYTTGLFITFKMAHTNSGTVVVNINTLGNKDLVNPDGSVMQSGQLSAGGIYDAQYDGTRFICLTGFAVPATAAQVQTGTSAITFVAPNTAQSHHSAAKAWGAFIGTNTGTITAESTYNIASIVRLGTGTYAITFSTAFSNTSYAGIVSVEQTGFNGMAGGVVDARSTVSCNISISSGAANAAKDGNLVSFVFYGLQ